MKNNIVTKKEAIAIHETFGEPTMSSLRIAEVTGKDHSDVLKTIRTIFSECEIGEGKFTSSYLSPQNKELIHYLLPEREFNLVVSGYSAKYRLELIDELTYYRKKEILTPHLPTNYISALEKLLETEKEKNQLSIENKSQARTIVMQKKELNEVNVQYARRGEMINTIMMSDNLYKATHLGNRFGISAVLFNRIMKDAKVIRKVSGVWTLMSKYTTASEPYAVLREERKAHSPEEETVMSFAWTSKGVNWVDKNWELALGRMSDETRKAYEKATSESEPTIPKKR